MIIRGLFVVGLALLCLGLDVFVDPAAYEGGNGSVDSPYSSLGEALDQEAAASEITLIMAPGTYQGPENLNIILNSKIITLISTFQWSGDTEIDTIVIDGANFENSFAFLVQGEGELQINGIHFQNLDSVITYISVDHTTTNTHPISITNCFLYNITGDAVVIQGIDLLSLTDSTIDSCHGSTVRVNGNLDDKGSASFSNLRIVRSGGLYLVNVAADFYELFFNEMNQRAIFFNPVKNSVNAIVGCSFFSPLAPIYQAAALYIQSTSSSTNVHTNVRIADSTFVGAATGEAGAIWIGNLFSAIDNCTFVNCYANNGGAIVLSSADVSINGCTFHNNQALVHGGALYLEQTTVLQLTRTVFSNNTAMYGNIAYCKSEDDRISAPMGGLEDYMDDIECIVSSQFSSGMEYSYYSSSYYYSDESFNYLYGYLLVVVQSLIICALVIGVAVGIYIYQRKKTAKENELVSEELSLEEDFEL